MQNHTGSKPAAVINGVKIGRKISTIEIQSRKNAGKEQDEQQQRQQAPRTELHLINQRAGQVDSASTDEHAREQRAAQEHRHDHGGDPSGLEQGVVQTWQGEPTVDHSQEDSKDTTNGCRLGGRCKPTQDGAQNCNDHSQRREKIARGDSQFLRKAWLVWLARYPRSLLGLHDTQHDDIDEVQARHEHAGQHHSVHKVTHRDVGQGAHHHDNDGRRDYGSQRTSGADNSTDQALVVAVAQHDRDGQQSDH